MENSMLKTIIIQINKANLNECKHNNFIYELEDMLEDLENNNVKVYELELNPYDALINNIGKIETISEMNIKNKIFSIISDSSTRIEECLIISDLSSVILTSNNLQIPCTGYDNPNMIKQDLYKANMVVEGFAEIDYKFLSDVYNRFYNLPIMIANTNRLIIREMVLEDLDELYELYSNEAITKYLEPLYEREEEIEFTKAYIKNMYGFYGYGLWSLIDKKTGNLIGRAGLNNRDVNGEIQIELGYMIGVHYQRLGYAFEACSKILEFAVIKLECFDVNCFINQQNEASVALVNKLGFGYIKEVEIEKEMLSLYRWTYN
jgi:RimJ/RimL family protein N-acetyltransferase